MAGLSLAATGWTGETARTPQKWVFPLSLFTLTLFGNRELYLYPHARCCLRVKSDVFLLRLLLLSKRSAETTETDPKEEWEEEETKSKRRRQSVT